MFRCVETKAGLWLLATVVMLLGGHVHMANAVRDARVHERNDIEPVDTTEDASYQSELCEGRKFALSAVPGLTQRLHRSHVQYLTLSLRNPHAARQGLVSSKQRCSSPGLIGQLHLFCTCLNQINQTTLQHAYGGVAACQSRSALCA